MNNSFVSDLDTFLSDRDNALLSLDEQKIRAFGLKYSIPFSDNPIVFWASVYKSVLAMKYCPTSIRRTAEDWLDSHGFERGYRNASEEPEEIEQVSRYCFEHVIFPSDFYNWGERLMNQVIDGDRRYMADLYSHVERDEHAAQPYKANFFRVLHRNYEDESGHAAIIRIDLPKPAQVLECRRIYLCHNTDTNALMYFTSELSMEGTYYLCAWTKMHSHLRLAMKSGVSEFDNVAELFRNFAGYEPQITEAV